MRAASRRIAPLRRRSWGLPGAPGSVSRRATAVARTVRRPRRGIASRQHGGAAVHRCRHRVGPQREGRCRATGRRQRAHPRPGSKPPGWRSGARVRAEIPARQGIDSSGDRRKGSWPPYQPSRIAYQRTNPMTAPTAHIDTRLVVKYGYTMNSSPAINCGHRCCFLPYTNSTKPIPPGNSETNNHAGSRLTSAEPLRDYVPAGPPSGARCIVLLTGMALTATIYNFDVELADTDR